MKIVLLDGYTLNPGDLDWTPLEQLGSFQVYDRVKPEEVVEKAKEADILLTNKAKITREVLEQLPNVKYIGVTATGYNIVDTEATRERGIPVTNVSDYSSRAVAQHTFALMLHFTNDVARLGESVRAKAWAQSPDFCYSFQPLTELSGKTLGLVGFGSIAKQVAQIGHAFGMRIMAHRRHAKPELTHPYVEMASLEDVFRESDFVSLHCPLTPETQGLVNAERLSWMKSTALLINTGRGPLIVEQDLADALNAGTIAGAGLDVLSVEPPSPDNPLTEAKNCLITPHVAWLAFEARRRLLQMAADNIRAFINGTPINVVN
ncbi:D-2-hydroxyacid dehydrogenase [Siphonobacter curvatus]|uniref:Glycerate dehydrogenase n=1 Tax=Siphonobacter curvatus TaxID=2094562 RepID=A0A2S7ILJ1_9BACT|nr:D-2-hydroxyacid dehydrogenase [Siphonobacter curvatus]PQA58509.1 glycerate dehydrogenase [Siphonobacter curvatus]